MRLWNKTFFVCNISLQYSYTAAYLFNYDKIHEYQKFIL